jgi:hypothetical protein
MTKTKPLRKSPFVTSSSTRSAHPKPTTCLLERKVSRLIHQRQAHSPWKLHSGWFSMLIWEPTKTSSVLKSRRQPKLRVKTSKRLKLSKSKLKTHFTQAAWSVHLRLWNACLFKTLNTRSLVTINTIKMRLMIQQPILSVQSYHYGDSQQQNHTASTLPPWHGTLATKISSLLPTEVTISLSKQVV